MPLNNIPLPFAEAETATKKCGAHVLNVKLWGCTSMPPNYGEAYSN